MKSRSLESTLSRSGSLEAVLQQEAEPCGLPFNVQVARVHSGLQQRPIRNVFAPFVDDVCTADQQGIDRANDVQVFPVIG